MNQTPSGLSQYGKRVAQMRAFFAMAMLSLIIASVPSFVYASNPGITYHGRLLLPDGVTAVTGVVTFDIQIKSPDFSNCVLYEETQLQNLTGNNGVFALTINDGSGTRIDAMPQMPIDDVFSNRAVINHSCAGGPYTPSPSDGRILKVTFQSTTMAMAEPMPDQSLNFAPFAIETKQITGFAAENILRFQNADTSLFATSPLNNAQYDELVRLVNGTSTQYAVAPNATTGTAIYNSATGSVSSPVVGDMWLDTSAGGSVDVLKIDTRSGVQSIPLTSGSFITSVAPGVGISVSTAGTVASVGIAAGGVGTTQLANSGVTAVKLDPAINIATTGYVSAHSFAVSNTQATPNTVGIYAPAAAFTNYTLVLPTSAGASGQVLQTDGTGNLSWANAAAGTLTSAHIFVGSAANVATDVAMSGDVGISNSGVTTVKGLQGVGISTTAPLDGQVLVFNNGANNWQPQNFSIGSLRTAIGGTQFANANCLSSQTLTWSSLTDTFSCTNISGLDASVITSGTIPMSHLPAGASDWANSGSNVYNTNSGNVGIGTSAPAQALDVVGSAKLSGGLIAGKMYPAADGTAAVQFNKANGTTNILDLDTTNARVGIGTTTPAYPLDVAGAVNATAFKINGVDISGGAGAWTLNGTNIYPSVLSNNVGIGTTAPVNALDIANGGGLHLGSGIPGSIAAALYNNAGTLTWNGTALSSGSPGIGGSGTTNFVPAFSGANTLTNSTIYSSGANVGIGTTSPQRALDVTTSSSAAGLVRLQNINSTGYSSIFYVDSLGTTQGSAGYSNTGAANYAGLMHFGSAASTSTPVALIANGAEALRIIPGGNVGIGTTAPGMALDVGAPSLSGALANFGTGTATQSNYLSVNGRAYFGYDGVRQNSVIQSIGSKGIDFNVNNSAFGSGTVLNISSLGQMSFGAPSADFGIGTYSSFNRLLAISGGSNSLNSNGVLLLGNTRTTPASGDNLGMIDFVSANNAAGDLRKGARITSVLQGIGGASGLGANLAFSTKADNGTLTEAMRVDLTGNVGIGTTAPAYKLDVAGSVRSATGGYVFPDGTTQTTAAVGAGTTNPWTQSGANLYPTTLTSNVGIGTTSPQRALDVTALASAAGLVRLQNTSSTGYSSIFYVDSSGTTQGSAGFSNTGAANYAGTMHFGSAASTSTPVALIANGVEAMRILPGGNVGIGTTATTAKLQISAGTSASGTAPLKLTAGTNLATPESGAVEYDGTNLYYTDGTATRRTIASSTATSAVGSLSSLTAATALNTIDSSNFAQTWNWSSATTQTPLSMNANALTTGSILSISSSNASLNSTTGLLSVANTGASTSGMVARIQSNSTAASGLTILASGNVGIGTTSPAYKLDVSGSVRSASGGYVFPDGTTQTTAAIGAGTTSPWAAYGSNIANINSGNVGIGTTAPAATLDVNGQFRVNSMLVGDGTSALPSIAFKSSTGTGLAWVSNLLSFSFAGNQEFKIGSGYVSGSGTGSPYLVGSGTPTAAAPAYAFNSATDTGLWSPAAATLQFVTGGVARLQVTSTGNAGIGTTAPAYKLDVAGSVRSSTGGYVFPDGTTQTTAAVGAGTTNPWAAYGSNIANINSGNVGIGTTSPGTALEVNGSIAASTGSASNPGLTFAGRTNVGLWSSAAGMLNISVSGTNTAQITTTNFASYARMNVSNGTTAAGPAYAFGGDLNTGVFNPAAQTVGVTTGGTERMRVDPAGNVGIGTTAPRARFEVAGGALVGADPAAASGSTVDFSVGNLQYTTGSCGAFQFNNLKSGGTYTFVVKGATSSTCAFTAYSDAGSTVLTVHYPPGHGATVASTHTMYTATVLGTDVYLSWITGY